MAENPTPYDALGKERLSELIDAFYDHVGSHPLLAPIFPDDLTETARKQKQFLTQFLGGPSLYTKEHGHPMLRARHLAFEITPMRAKAWLSCMEKAMDSIQLDSPLREYLLGRLTITAEHMINTNDIQQKGDSYE
ncbi:globin [Bacillus sp. E214]|uniref:globin domain-containing protein n=1 Tax=Bacillus sp. E214 TaxID=2587156 RepID=UPI0011DFF5F0|nr:globin [Bacillus sp. E214]